MEENFRRILFLPIIMILGVLPLIVRAKVKNLEGAVSSIFGKSSYIEFYTQGKATILIGVAILMVLLIIFFTTKGLIEIKESRYMIVYIVGASLFLVGAFLSTIFSEYKGVALLGMFDRSEGLLVIISYVIIMFYSVIIFQNIKDKKYIYVSLTCVIVVSTILGISQYIGKDLMLTDLSKSLIVPNALADIRDNMEDQFKKGIITCTFYNPNYVGSFSAIVVPLFFMRCFITKNRLSFWGCIVLTVCTIFLLIASKSTAGLLAMGITCILAVFMMSKHIIYVFESHKKGTLVSGVCVIIIICSTVSLWENEFKWLSVQVVDTFFTQHDRNEYLNEVIIKDVSSEEGKTVFQMQTGKLIIGKDSEALYFIDEQGNPVSVEDDKDIIRIKDSRFESFYFRKIYDEENPTKLSGMEFLQYISKYNRKKVGKVLFTLNVKDGVNLINAYTNSTIQNEVAESIGFKGKEKAGTGRGYIWSRSVPLLKETLLIGHGPDTYAMYFPQSDLIGKYYTFESPMIIVDKPHNMYLQIGINLGVMALVGFLIMVGTYLIQSIKLYSLKKRYKRFDKFALSLTWSVFGYLVVSIFNDSTVCVAPIFFIILGIGIAVNHMKEKMNEQ